MATRKSETPYIINETWQENERLSDFRGHEVEADRDGHVQ